MQNSLVSGDDMRYLVQQTPEALTTIMGQMISLVQDITDLQNDTDERIAAMEKQPWHKKMWMTITGKNASSKAEIQRNQDKIVGYISEAVSQLYQMNCINQQVMCSLGNRMNQVYAQVTEVYNEQLQMKAQMAEIMAVQQQTIQALGGFVTKLNEKIESVDNFHMLITEIQQGQYQDTNKLYSLCCVLAQLDKRTLGDGRKLNILRGALEKSNIINEDSITIHQYLMDILSLPDDKVGIVYLELCNFRNSFPANLFAETIENYHFLPKIEKISKSKDVLIQKLLVKYELDASAEFSFADVSESFLENKQNSFSDTNMIQVAEKGITDEYLEKITDTLLKKHENGEDVSKELSILLPYAESGNFGVRVLISIVYIGSLDTENSYVSPEEAFDFLRKTAELVEVDSDDPEIIEAIAGVYFLLGYCYLESIGISKDDTEAIKWLKKSSEQGSDDAMLVLGDCYLNGVGVEQSYEEAVTWYHKAAEQGNADAMYKLGVCYQKGNGVSENQEKSVEWLKKAAEQNCVEAQLALGEYYFSFERNYEEAAMWYRKSAEQGCEEAQNYLDLMFNNEEYIQQNPTKAIEWYHKAAEQGYAPAQYNLGYCYFYGKDVGRDRGIAYYWINLSANQGYELAINFLKEHL